MSGGGYFGFQPAGTLSSSTQYGSNNYGNYAAAGAAGYGTAGQQPAATQQQSTGYFQQGQQAGGTQQGYNYGTTTGQSQQAQSHSSYASSGGQAHGYNASANTKSGGTAKNTNAAGSTGSAYGSGGGSYGQSSATTGGNNASGTSYSGYDAAVYAAATSYLQSKTQGGAQGANQWLGLKKPRGGAGGMSGGGMGGGRGGGGQTYHRGGGRGGGYNNGGYNNQNQNRGPGGQGGGGGQQQLHYCEVCKISCAGALTYKEHLEGQRHKKKEAAAKAGDTPSNLSKTRVSFRCDLCDVTMTGQDTYNAHVRGAKHQKTLKLHQQLGKPIPSGEPTMIAPTATGVVTTGGEGKDGKRVIGVAGTKFVSGQNLSSTAGLAEVTKAGDATTAAAVAAESNIQPVGEDYVEEVREGARVSYHCKLCDCNFNDPMARDMHLKGRRHRLQYKKKVNPDLVVDGKGMNSEKRASEEKLRKELMRLRQQELWSMRAMYSNAQMSQLPGANVGPPQPLFGKLRGPRDVTLDDRHVMAKHEEIYPNEDELSTIQKLVINIEKSLKAVSDEFAEKDTVAANGGKPIEKKLDEEGRELPPENEVRELKGVMRVGLLAKGLLLKGDKNVELVLLCAGKPTKKLLARVEQSLPAKLQEVSGEEKLYKIEKKGEQLEIVTLSEPVFLARCTFTSVMWRDGQPASAAAVNETPALANEPTPKDALDKSKCLNALAELRHAKWFQARCSNLQSCLIVLRIMRDICQRIPTWQPLTSWAVELLVEKVLTSSGVPLTPGEAVRRVFEAVASGIMFADGPGLLDPCEKDVLNVIEKLSGQEREDMTSSAQHALRLISFNQMHKILAVDRLPDRRKRLSDRKRPRSSQDSTGALDPKAADSNGEKKDKKDADAK